MRIRDVGKVPHSSSSLERSSKTSSGSAASTIASLWSPKDPNSGIGSPAGGNNSGEATSKECWERASGASPAARNLHHRHHHVPKSSNVCPGSGQSASGRGKQQISPPQPQQLFHEQYRAATAASRTMLSNLSQGGRYVRKLEPNIIIINNLVFPGKRAVAENEFLFWLCTRIFFA